MNTPSDDNSKTDSAEEEGLVVLGLAHAIGKWRYEEDCKKRPNYHDGTARKTWEELGDVEQWSWYRNPPVNTEASQWLSQKTNDNR